MKGIFKFLFYSIIIAATIFPIVQILYRLLNGIPIDGLLSSLPYVYLGVVIFYALGFLFIKYVLKSLFINKSPDTISY